MSSFEKMPDNIVIEEDVPVTNNLEQGTLTVQPNSDDNVSNNSANSTNSDNPNNLDESDQITINSSTEDIYVFLINKLYDTLNDNENITCACKDENITKPIVRYDFSSKRTVWDNFSLNCQQINRSDEDLQKFLLKEFKAGNSVSSKGELRLKGRYNTMINSAFERYLQDYVVCKACKSIKTTIHVNYANNLDYIICNNNGCGKKRAIKPSS